MEIIFIIDIFITEIYSSLILNLISTFVLHYTTEGPGGSMSEEVVFPNNTYKPAPIRRRFASGFVNYQKSALDSQPQVIKYQLLAHGRWFSPSSSTTKTGRHDIAEILLKVALNTINQSIIMLRESLTMFSEWSK
jgi:hypothetical protein